MESKCKSENNIINSTGNFPSHTTGVLFSEAIFAKA